MGWSVNRCLRCHGRVALKFWKSRRHCQEYPKSKSNPEHKSEGFLSTHLSLPDTNVSVVKRKRNKSCDRRHILVE